MNISELIEKLEEIKAAEGDALDVWFDWGSDAEPLMPADISASVDSVGKKDILFLQFYNIFG